VVGADATAGIVMCSGAASDTSGGVGLTALATTLVGEDGPDNAVSDDGEFEPVGDAGGVVGDGVLSDDGAVGAAGAPGDDGPLGDDALGDGGATADDGAPGGGGAAVAGGAAGTDGVTGVGSAGGGGCGDAGDGRTGGTDVEPAGGADVGLSRCRTTSRGLIASRLPERHATTAASAPTAPSAASTIMSIRREPPPPAPTSDSVVRADSDRVAADMAAARASPAPLRPRLPNQPRARSIVRCRTPPPRGGSPGVSSP
jgi:hypothetical protein